MKQEPVATLGAAILGVVVAGVALLPDFGIGITVDQQAAIIAFATALITLGTVVTRSYVTPVDTANEKIAQAFNANPTAGDQPPLLEKGLRAKK